MAGIYIHVPFCHRACHYCDFHFSTNLRHVDGLVEAIAIEIARRKSWLPSNERIETIYFGGGTPSILQERHFGQIFESLHTHYDLSDVVECTMEANPEDLTTSYIRSIAQTPINRFSIGIQSFRERDLKWMNRQHSPKQALESIRNAQEGGFDKLTVDLIYGLPELSSSEWESHLATIDELGIDHLSAYGLTVEPSTPLGYQVEKGLEHDTDEDLMSEHFDLLMDWAEAKGFEHYEISNFARNNQRSIHNSNYWNGKPYIGIGPGAHGFNGEVRSANVASNLKYMHNQKQGVETAEFEKLEPTEKLNEHILTQLRRIEGIDLSFVGSDLNNLEAIQKSATPLIQDGLLIEQNNHFILTRKGKHLADYVASRLFL